MSNNASPALLPEVDRRDVLYNLFERAAGGPINSASPVQDPGYGEIGTAQSLQAEACKLVPRVEMNPVLLKSGGKNSKGEAMCSVFVLGKQMIRETYDNLRKRTGSLQQMVLGSHQALMRTLLSLKVRGAVQSSI
jgi:adenosylcobyric acid synthase